MIFAKIKGPPQRTQNNISPLLVFTSIIVFGVILRFFIFSFIHTQNMNFFDSPQIDTNYYNLYHEALIKHFWEYFFYTHTVTPNILIRDWFNHSFITPELHSVFNFCFISLLHCFGAWFAYLTLTTLKVPNSIAIISALLLSIRLIGWELTPSIRSGSWDTEIPFLIILFLWSLANVIKNKTNKSILLSSISSFFLVSSLQSALLIIIPTLVFTIYIANSYRFSVRWIIYSLSLPLILSATLILKNGYNFGVYAPTTGMGQNTIQNLSLSVISPTSSELINFAESLNYPSWWTWCYKEAKRRYSNRKYPHAMAFYGACDKSPTGQPDLDGIKTFLKINGPENILDLIKKDELTLASKPWLFAGYGVNRPTRFNVAYGNVSNRLFFDVIKHAPYGYAVRTYTNLKYYFFINGSKFEEINPSLEFSLESLKQFQALTVPIIRLGMILSYLFTILIPTWLLGLAFFQRKLSQPPNTLSITWIISLGVSLGTFSSVGFSCCENYRYAFYYFGPVWILATLGTYVALKKITLILKKLHTI